MIAAGPCGAADWASAPPCLIFSWIPLTSEAEIDGNGETSGFRGWCPAPLAVPCMPGKKHALNDRHPLQVVMLQHQQQFDLTVR
jgi:hypothetical protein